VVKFGGGVGFGGATYELMNDIDAVATCNAIKVAQHYEAVYSPMLKHIASKNKRNIKASDPHDVVGLLFLTRT
jgi:hypothetical protein